MSIIKSLQDWMEDFVEYAVLTDQVDAVGENALSPVGNGLYSRDVLGREIHTKNYAFYAMEHATFEPDRAENQNFMEEFDEWIRQKNEKEEFPILPDPWKITEIKPSNGILFDVHEDGRAIYQMQISVKLERSNNG